MGKFSRQLEKVTLLYIYIDILYTPKIKTPDL